jgi:hypothetical protein
MAITTTPYPDVPLPHTELTFTSWTGQEADTSSGREDLTSSSLPAKRWTSALF